jgi:glycosyltransferase involved in cell wall biosynthesis
MGRATMITVAHVITGLGRGGAETMLLKLLQQTDRSQFSMRVFSLLAPPGPLAERIEALGIPVEALGMGRQIPSPGRLWHLARRLRATRPDMVQTWMYHGDLVGGIAAKLASVRLPVLWNIRQSTFDAGHSRRRTMRIARVCAMLSSRLPQRIICCSDVARRVHVDLGYDDSKIQVIPNGFDSTAFRPDAEARAAIRAELGVPADSPLVGMVARFDAQKDHQTFIAAAGRVHARMPNVRFVLCGTGVDRNNAELVDWIARAGLSGVSHLLGERADIARVTAALDLATLSSAFGEGFPNVLGEAMACEVACVATDVGESGYVVGDTGRVVPPRDPAALANAWTELLVDDAARRALGRLARQRVVDNFAIARVTRTYESAYQAIVAANMGSREPLPHLS